MRKSQESLAEIFGSQVFSDAVMRVRLPKNIYRQLRRTIEEGAELDPTVAEVVAAAMKDWAVERGATHFTHWFQPMTGLTAEKHDSFISPNGEGGVILEFSGKELVKGEPDASSFPSGGLRATFEARGYTAWDCSSPAFIKEDVGGVIALCIPTAFCSYNGEALDKKTPLLRSMEAISRQALRVLRLLGDNAARRVYPTVGAEQEYFLVDKALYQQRPDLVFTGRTLIGAPPPKGQEMSDQYYGTIRPRVSEFMAELNEELWKLGVPAKTQHNEAAPAQHELASVYTVASIAVDHNQLTMEMMKKVADRHGLACLLHEKPFLGLAGSGKHNNWSLATDTGRNLLSPGKGSETNMTFLTFFCAVIAAVDRWAPLLRWAAASAGNDHRLGGHEAPPPILSVFIGEVMHGLLCGLGSGNGAGLTAASDMKIGVAAIPFVRRDNVDRNRTAPIAFTGNKFEFRMPGASMNIADVNTILNTIVANELKSIADQLDGVNNVSDALTQVLSRLMKQHERILFEGNNYSEQWRKEAAERGLPVAETSVEAFPALGEAAAVELLQECGVLTRAEIESRVAVMRETYHKSVHIEALTLLSMARTQVLPACLTHAERLAHTASAMEAAGVSGEVPRLALARMSEQLTALSGAMDGLQVAVDAAEGCGDAAVCAAYCRDTVLPAMQAVRKACDSLELAMPRAQWPFPTYADLLYST